MDIGYSVLDILLDIAYFLPQRHHDTKLHKADNHHREHSANSAQLTALFPTY
jgi:hypothetical protein